MKIIISPAKTIDLNVKKTHVHYTFPKFIKESEKLVKKLKKYKVKDLMNLFHVSNEIATLNFERFQNWTCEETSEDLIPCAFAFNGEVYRGLNIQSFKEKELSYIKNHLYILSGLYGVLNSFDLIYPYRLEMGTNIKLTEKVNNLYQFWGDKLSHYMNEIEQENIINLASSEYFKALNLKKIKAKVITPIFKEFRNGEYKIVMTYAKNARGEMARYMTNNLIENVEEIKNFNLSSYSYDDKLSNENNWVFVR